MSAALHTRAARIAGVLVALGLLAAGANGCSDDGPGEGEARLEVDGVALVDEAGGGRDEVTGTATLHRGDKVTIEDGTGRLTLPGGARLELRAALDDGSTDDTRVTIADVPVLESGDVLVLSDEPVQVEAAGSTVRVERGAARVARYLGFAVAVYEGAASIDSAGVQRDVRSLRRLSVPAFGRPARDLKPISYDARDPWDRRFLGEAIALGTELDALASTYTGSLSPGEGRSVGFFRLVLPGLEDERDFTQELLEDGAGDPGSNLIGAAITDLGGRGSFTDRWRQVFDFRSQGAAWGIVALDQAVTRGPLVGTVEDALGATTFEFSTPATTPVSPPPVADSGGGDTPPPTTAPTTPPTAPPTTPPTTPPAEPGPLDPVVDLIDPVEQLVNDLLDSLLDPDRG